MEARALDQMMGQQWALDLTERGTELVGEEGSGASEASVEDDGARRCAGR